MSKDFQYWHIQKSKLDESKIRPFFHEREIWFASLGANIGYEQDGKGEGFLRPIIVFKKFGESLFAIPLTRKIKQGNYYFSFDLHNRGRNTAILSQLRLIDSKRLRYKIGTMDFGEYSLLKQKLKLLIA